jgi:hypothetical protein
MLVTQVAYTKREFIGMLFCLTEIKLNYFKDTDTQQDAFHKEKNHLAV